MAKIKQTLTTPSNKDTHPVNVDLENSRYVQILTVSIFRTQHATDIPVPLLSQPQSPPFSSMMKLQYPTGLQPPPSDPEKPLISLQDENAMEYPSILEEEIDSLSADLRKWSMEIFGFAEIAMKEFKTHDLIAQIFEQTPGELPLLE
jgi:hypothetical protein